MQVLIDTNVVLDVLMQRPGMEFSWRILQLSGKGRIRGFLSVSAVTDIYYILNRQIKDRPKTVESIKKILSLIDVADVTGDAIRAALDCGWKDFEDSEPQPITPEAFLAVLSE